VGEKRLHELIGRATMQSNQDEAEIDLERQEAFDFGRQRPQIRAPHPGERKRVLEVLGRYGRAPWVLERAGDLGLHRKAAAVIQFVGEPLMNFLERHVAVEFIVVRHEDRTESTPRERPQLSIATSRHDTP